MFDVTTYGAVGDGTTDDREAIQDAIDACVTAGGGVVYLPQGTYLLDSAHPSVSGVSLNVDGDNVVLRGFTRQLSVLVLGDDLNISIVNFQNCNNPTIETLTIDGNRVNQTGNSHGVRQGATNTGLTIRDMYIHDTSSYGIGIQHGTTTDCLIENVLIEDTGADGIDIKNPNQDNRNNRMNNTTVRRAGLRDDLSGQVCIDVRGIWNLNNIICEEYDNTTHRCNAGVRFRAGDVSTPNTAAHWSTLTNFYIKAGTTADEVNGITQSATQVVIGDGQIQQCTKGILFNGVEASVNNVIARDCSYGFFFDTDSNGTTLSGCSARECNNSGFYVRSDGCSITGLQARGNAYGVNLQSTSQNTVLSGVSTANSTSNLYTESGHTKNSTGLIS